MAKPSPIAAQPPAQVCNACGCAGACETPEWLGFPRCIDADACAANWKAAHPVEAPVIVVDAVQAPITDSRIWSLQVHVYTGCCFVTRATGMTRAQAVEAARGWSDARGVRIVADDGEIVITKRAGF